MVEAHGGKRKGAGRPRFKKGLRGKPVCIYMTTEAETCLDEVRKAYNTGKSEAVAIALEHEAASIAEKRK